MFDPLFPVALFSGPLALAVLLRIEVRRETRSIWPRIASVVLALGAMWGLTYWGVIIAVGLFGEGMQDGGLREVTVLAISASVVIVVGGYALVARHRSQRVPR